MYSPLCAGHVGQRHCRDLAECHLAQRIGLIGRPPLVRFTSDRRPTQPVPVRPEGAISGQAFRRRSLGNLLYS
jgi:hypothetical protein